MNIKFNTSILFTILFMLLSINICFSQNSKQDFKRLNLGFLAGLNYPDIRFENDDSYNNFKVNFLIGLSLEYYVSEKLSFKTNINYERKHRKNEVQILSNVPPFNIQGSEYYNDYFHYLNIPFFFKYEFYKHKFFVNSGPFINYLINLDRELVPEDEAIFEKVDQKDFDFGLTFGLGYQIPIEKQKLSIELRNDLGLIDVGGYYTSQSSYAKTNTIKLIVGWSL